MATIGKLSVLLDVDGRRFGSNLKNAERQLDRSTQRMGTALAGLKRHWLAFTAGAATVALIGRSFVRAASEAQQYKVRLDVLLRSQEKSNQLFAEMSQFAKRVPFEYQDIMGSATQLAGVMRGGVQEIGRWMPLIADLAATSGLGIQETTAQVVRMYSAGAGAADLFRDRGITAMLGFKAKVAYTAEETRKILMQEWEKAGSQFRGATDKLAGTWVGRMSMLSDAWNAFQIEVMNSGILEYLTNVVNTLTGMVAPLTKMFRFIASLKGSGTGAAAMAEINRNRQRRMAAKRTAAGLPPLGYGINRQPALTPGSTLSIPGGGSFTIPSPPVTPPGPAIPGISGTGGGVAMRGTPKTAVMGAHTGKGYYREFPGLAITDVEAVSRPIDRAFEAMNERWNNFQQNVIYGWSNTVDALINGTMRWGQAAKNIFNQVLASYIHMLAQMAGQRLFEETMPFLSSLPGLGGGQAAMNVTVSGNTAEHINRVIADDIRYGGY